jgi:hypothetical protein
MNISEALRIGGLDNVQEVIRIGRLENRAHPLPAPTGKIEDPGDTEAVTSLRSAIRLAPAAWAKQPVNATPLFLAGFGSATTSFPLSTDFAAERDLCPRARVTRESLTTSTGVGADDPPLGALRQGNDRSGFQLAIQYLIPRCETRPGFCGSRALRAAARGRCTAGQQLRSNVSDHERVMVARSLPTNLP